MPVVKSRNWRTHWAWFLVLHKPFSADVLTTQIKLAVDCRQSFFGNLHGLTLIDILQMYHLGKKSVTVTIGGPAGGYIDVADGEIVNAELRELRGETALRAFWQCSRVGFRRRRCDT